MKAVFTTIGGVVALAALAALFAGHVLLVNPGWSEIKDAIKPFDAPAWVQAVGSVGAILASIAVVQWQHQLERERAREAERLAQLQRLDVIVEIVRSTGEHASYVANFYSNRERLHMIDNRVVFHDEQVLQSLGQEIAAIPLHEVGDARIVNELAILSANCRQMKGMVSDLLSNYRRLNAFEFQDVFRAMANGAQACRASYEMVHSRVIAYAQGEKPDQV